MGSRATKAQEKKLPDHICNRRTKTEVLLLGFSYLFFFPIGCNITLKKKVSPYSTEINSRNKEAASPLYASLCDSRKRNAQEKGEITS